MTKRSAEVVVVRRVDGVPRCLLLRCYGYWDFPKGEVEPGEEPLATARREVTEETRPNARSKLWSARPSGLPATPGASPHEH